MPWYREVFFAYNGPGPYRCYFCRKSVTMVDVEVHHKDEDHKNDTRMCKPKSPRHRQCIAEANRKRAQRPGWGSWLNKGPGSRPNQKAPSTAGQGWTRESVLKGWATRRAKEAARVYDHS